MPSEMIAPLPNVRERSDKELEDLSIKAFRSMIHRLGRSFEYVPEEQTGNLFELVVPVNGEKFTVNRAVEAYRQKISDTEKEPSIESKDVLSTLIKTLNLINAEKAKAKVVKESDSEDAVEKLLGGKK